MINPVNIRLHSIIKAATGGYEKQRILKFNPINGAKIEVMRFNMQKNPNTKLPCKLKIALLNLIYCISDIKNGIHNFWKFNIDNIVSAFEQIRKYKTISHSISYTPFVERGHKRINLHLNYL